jgi:hypothetical protein
VLPSNSAVSGNPYAAPPSPTAPAFPGQLASLADAQPGAFVAVPDRSIAPDLRTAALAPAIPGGRSNLSAETPFGFLQEARPIFVEPEAELPVVQTPS